MQDAIDIHTHPILYGKGASHGEIGRLVADSRARGIQRMVVLGDVLVFGLSPDAPQIEHINRQTAQLMAWHPDFFIGLCHVNPTLGEAHVASEAERCIAAGGFRGFKLEQTNNARDACMRHVMKIAARLGVPVLQHTWSMTNQSGRRTNSDPEDTVLLAKRYPDVQVIMAHLTGVGFRGVLEAKGVDNLVVDTSGGFPEAEILEYAIEHLGADRIAYGSDLPIREPGVTLGRVTGSRVSRSDLRKILLTNAQRILKL